MRVGGGPGKRKLFGYKLSKGGRSSSKTAEVDGREAPFLFVRCYGNAWARIRTVSAGRKL